MNHYTHGVHKLPMRVTSCIDKLLTDAVGSEILLCGLSVLLVCSACQLVTNLFTSSVRPCMTSQAGCTVTAN